MSEIHKSIKQMLYRKPFLAFLPLLLTFAPFSNAQEEENKTSVLEELVVTAQKRSQSLQDVPMSISAISGDKLRDQGVANIYQLSSLAPNLDINNTQGQVKIFIRGIGKILDVLGGEGAVALHQDGGVISYPGIQNTAFYDVERVEVLRGPQGTLYGRNATGGAVNFITRAPSDDFRADLRASLGNFDSREIELGIGGSIIKDKLQGRFALLDIDRGGFGINVVDGQEIDDRNETGLRGKLKWLATENLTVDLEYDRWTADDAATVIHTFGPAGAIPLRGVADGGIADPNLRDIASDSPSVRDYESNGAQLKINYDINDSWSLSSLTSYRDVEGFQQSQFDGTSSPGWPVTRMEDGRHYSEELLLNWESDRSNAVFGLYYFDNEIFNASIVPFEFAISTPGDIFQEQGTARTTAKAAFGNFTWGVTDKSNLTFGIRYSEEDRDSDGFFRLLVQGIGRNVLVPQDRSKSFDAVTPRFVWDYALSDNTNTYFSVSRGFKSGQIIPGNTSPPVDSEFVWAYELGLKTTSANGKFSGDFAAFYYDYTDLQVSQLRGLAFVLNNAGEAEVRGLEAEISYLIGDRTRIDLVAGYLDSEIKDFFDTDTLNPQLGVQDLSGNPLPQSSKYSFTLSASHTIPSSVGDFDLRVDWRWKDKAFFDPFARDEAAQDAYSNVNMRATYRPKNNDKWSLAAWVTNAGDEEVILNNYISLPLGGFPRNGAVNEPRRYGIEFSYKY